MLKVAVVIEYGVAEVVDVTCAAAFRAGQLPTLGDLQEFAWHIE